MEKANLYLEMRTALKAASIQSLILEALELESKNGGEPDREQNMKIGDAKRDWLFQMMIYSTAFTKYNRL